jgi:hypothetical protein
MGGGFVLFGIGGDVQGGLADIFTGGKSGDAEDGNPLVEDRAEQAEKRLRTNPRDAAALKDLTRARFQLASGAADPNTGAYGPAAKADLQRSSDAWERLLRLNPERPDTSLARQMLQVYGPFALNQPAKGAKAAEILTQAQPTSATFLQLAQFARFAKQDRKAELAGRRAVDLAPKDERKLIREQLKQLEAAGKGGGSAAGGAPPAAGGSGGR